MQNIKAKKGSEEVDIININKIAKEIAQVLEKHNVKISDMDSVLDSTKNIILSNTPVHAE